MKRTAPRGPASLLPQATFAIVPTWVLDAEVSDRAIRLYAVLARYADDDRRAWPSRRTLADRLRCSLASTDRAVTELVNAGALLVEERHRPGSGGQTSSLFVLVSVPVHKPVDEDTRGPRGLITGEDPPSSRVTTHERKPLNEVPPNPAADAPGSCAAHRGKPAKSCRACGTNPRAQAKAERTKRPPWCGECDETTRLTMGTDPGPVVLYRCPRCHPLAATA